MSQHKNSRRKSKAPQTNWKLISGVVGAIILIFGIMVFLSNRGPDVTDLGAYCDENPKRCLSWGAADAPVTILEVSDYGCPHCRDFNTDTAPELQRKYVQAGQVRWVILPFALRSQTVPPANAALCAKDSAQIGILHEGLFGLQDVGFGDDSLLSVARNTDVLLNEASYTECVEDGTYNNTITANIAAANAVGVDSTPTFFINGEQLRGAQPLAAFEQRIDSFLDR